MAENDGAIVSPPSEETERLLSVRPTVMYFLKAMPGSPEQRAHAAARMIQEFFPNGAISTLDAHSALESFCIAHGLDVAVYLKPKSIQENPSTSVTS